MHKIRKDDMVKVIAGKDKDKQGKVLHVDTKTNKILVEGCNMVTKHVKPRRMGEQGGIVKKETPIRACKVALYCGKCGKGVRIGFQVEGEKKTRVCTKCGAEI